MNKIITPLVIGWLGLLPLGAALAQNGKILGAKGNVKNAAPSSASFDYGEIVSDLSCPLMMDLQHVIDDYLVYKEQIGITPDQLARLKELREKYQTETVRINADLNAATLKLSNLLYEDDISQKTIRSQSELIGKLEGELRAKNIEVFMTARGILNREQLNKAQDQGIKSYPFQYLNYRPLFK